MRAIFLLSLCIISLQAFELGWSHNYQEGLKEATKKHKLVYVLITSDRCGWCRKFERTTLQINVIKKRLHHEFITIHLSRERDIIPKKFKTAPIPRHYFVDAKGNILYASLGYRDEELFNSFMDNAEEKFQENKERK